jgi:hypothetical protein
MIAYFIGFCVSVIIEDIKYKKLLKESKRLTNEINNIK